MSLKHKVKSGNRIAAYARYSSDNQRDESIDAQLLAIKEYCEANGYVITKQYIDRAKSATTDKRPEFIQMIKDSSKELFDKVVVHKLDRFSRNRYDSAYYKRILSKNGIKLFSVVEHLDDSPESIMMESVLTGMAEYYSRNLGREVMKGLKQNALTSRTTGGRPPLGYDIDPISKKYVLNETEAITVREIFKLYNEEKGYNKIIGELNAKGYKTKLGNPFGKNSIHDILCNEKYTGVYIFNRSASKCCDGTRNNHENKDEDEIIRNEGGVPEIITKDEFKEARERMNKNKRSPGSYKAKENYLLSGLVYCGECGHKMSGNMRHGGRSKKKFVSYKCCYRTNYKSCDNKEIRKEYLENYVLSELQRLVFNDKAIPKLTKKLNEYQSKKKTQGSGEIERIEAKIHDIDTECNNIVNAIANGFMQDSFKEKMNELDTKKAILENSLNEIKENSEPAFIDEKALSKMVTRFKQFVEEKNVPECKKFINAFVDKVVVYKDHVEVIFKIPSSIVSPSVKLNIKSEEEIKTLFKKNKVA